MKQSPCREADHFVMGYVDEQEVFESVRAPREPAPRWIENKGLCARFPLFFSRIDDTSSRFNVSSTIRIVIYRRSLMKRLPLKKNFVAEWNGTGLDLMDNGKVIVYRYNAMLMSSRHRA